VPVCQGVVGERVTPPSSDLVPSRRCRRRRRRRRRRPRRRRY